MKAETSPYDATPEIKNAQNHRVPFLPSIHLVVKPFRFRSTSRSFHWYRDFVWGGLVRSTNGAGWEACQHFVCGSANLSIGGHTVDLHLAVGNNRLDLTLLLQVLQALACEGAVDL